MSEDLTFRDVDSMISKNIEPILREMKDIVKSMQMANEKFNDKFTEVFLDINALKIKHSVVSIFFGIIGGILSMFTVILIARFK